MALAVVPRDNKWVGILTDLGFSGEPFAKLNAESEPDLAEYFVKAPFYATISGRALNPDSYVLFGARGSGKSATRLATYREVWDRVARGDKSPIAVTLDSYDRVLSSGLESVGPKQFVEEIAFLVIEAILLWLSHLSAEDRTTYTSALTAQELRLARLLIDACYLKRSEASRQISGSQALRVINSAWLSRVSHWASRNWSTVADVIGALISAIASRHADVKLEADKHVAPLLRLDAFGPEHADGRALLERLVSFVQSFGFTGIVVLVDKADETPATSDSAPNAAQLLYPLLSSMQLMELQHLGWIFFLWDRVRDEYTSEASFKIRLDKMQHTMISWPEAELVNLVNSRLSHYSGRRICAFSELCDRGVDAEDAIVRIVRTSARSPRELIKALDTIVRQHDEAQSSQQGASLLTSESIDRGLDAYCVDSVPATYPANLVAPLLRLKLTTFVNRDVQQRARIGGPAARGRIQKWVDANLVSLSGQRAAAGGAGGKPASEYTICDPRVIRVVERNLRLSNQIEMMLEAREDEYFEAEANDDDG